MPDERELRAYSLEQNKLVRYLVSDIPAFA